MARAGVAQADIVHDNIIALANGCNPTAEYIPRIEKEGAIKLTLGKEKCVIYRQGADGTTNIVPHIEKSEDLDIEKVWHRFGVGSLFQKQKAEGRGPIRSRV